MLRSTRWLISPFIVVIAVLACGSLGRSAAPQAPPTVAGLAPTATLPGPGPTTISTVSPEPSAGPSSAANEITAVPPAPLSAQGPWLLLYGESVWALNADGSGLTQLLASAPSRLFVAPSGGRLAFLTAEDWKTYRGLALNMLSLPGGGNEAVTSLLPSGKEFVADDVDKLFDDPLFEALRAIVDHSEPVWSPDGGRLAFVGAQDGVSADVYVYSARDRRITRLTDGLSQAYHLSWSPDGRYVVHVGADGFGTGAGYGLAGVWAAAADGSGVRTLYTPRSSGDEVILGWRGPHEFVVYSFTAACSYFGLRVFDLDTGQTQPLWNYFDSAAMDPESGALVFSVDDFVAGCNGDGQTGTFLVSPDGAQARRIWDEALYPAWDQEARLFRLRHAGNADMLLTPQGVVIGSADQAEGVLSHLPDGRRYAWTKGDGSLWVASRDEMPRPVFAGNASVLSWSPDQASLFFSADHDGQPALYVARAPDFVPYSIGAGLPLQAAWAQP